MLAAVCEISSPFGSCVDETATRADVYNHVLNKYWMENNKKRRESERERSKEGGGERNEEESFYIIFKY